MAEKCDATPSVASTPSYESGSGNWWDSWLSSAKTKSAEVYSMVRKDLDEIGSAVKSEASHVFSTTSNVIGKTLKLDVPESPANVMKKSFSTFIGQVSTVLNPELDDEDDTEVILSSGDTTMLSTYKKELEALQRVDATFIVPAYSAEFDAWRASLENADSIVSMTMAAKRLDTSPLLRSQYDKLVPDAVSHDEFWERYLFRVALLQDRLAAAARKQPATETSNDPVLAHLPLQTEKEASPIEQSPKKVLTGLENEETPLKSSDIDAVTWEDEDFAHDVELSEEQQILLLEEYEKEITSKKLSKQTSSRDIANNNTQDKTTNTANVKKAGMKITVKASNNTKIAVTTKSRDKQNNKPTEKQAKKSPKKGKADDCGNNLVEDYFGDKDNQVKDDASANSDESWEKEFEIEDTKP